MHILHQKPSSDTHKWSRLYILISKGCDHLWVSEDEWTAMKQRLTLLFDETTRASVYMFHRILKTLIRSSFAAYSNGRNSIEFCWKVLLFMKTCETKAYIVQRVYVWLKHIKACAPSMYRFTTSPKRQRLDRQSTNGPSHLSKTFRYYLFTYELLFHQIYILNLGCLQYF